MEISTMSNANISKEIPKVLKNNTNNNFTIPTIGTIGTIGTNTTINLNMSVPISTNHSIQFGMFNEGLIIILSMNYFLKTKFLLDILLFTGLAAIGIIFIFVSLFLG